MLSAIVDNFTSEERRAVIKRRLVDDDSRSFRLDAFHNALNGRLAEVVGVGFLIVKRYTPTTISLCFFSLSEEYVSLLP